MEQIMPDIKSLSIFIAAAAILLITPGPAVLYIVTRSIHQGRAAGIISVLGIAAGTLFHVAFAAFGISAILLSSSLAFNIVKYTGAAYLIYFGIKSILTKDVSKGSITFEKKKLSKVFYQGILVNLLNPKTALFFFAFLPQFINADNGNIVSQILFLGFLFVVMGIFSDGIWAWLAGSLGNWLRKNLRILHYQKYFSGIVYLALGVTTAFSGNGKK